jgi:phosphoribosylglycinamide formyltransferase-1
LSHQNHIAIFASGQGSNALKIIEHFALHKSCRVVLIVCNKPGAGVLDIAKAHHIPFLLIEKDRFFNGDGYIPEFQKYSVDIIVLAGFLWKVPGLLIQSFPKKIVNIHPALLPAYGGKGMYGHYVHEAVIAHNEKQSGITIHYVDELYDHGEIIFKATCPVDEHDTPKTLAEKIHLLEHEHYAPVIERCFATNNNTKR